MFLGGGPGLEVQVGFSLVIMSWESSQLTKKALTPYFGGVFCDWGIFLCGPFFLFKVLAPNINLVAFPFFN